MDNYSSSNCAYRIADLQYHFSKKAEKEKTTVYKKSSYTHMKTIEDTNKKIYEISNEINELIREQKDTKGYIEKKKKEIEQIRQMIVTNDTILDCTISDKRDLATEKQIAFTYNIPTGLPEIQMEDVDKIRLFANLLDNAIEAAESVPAQDINGDTFEVAVML